MGVPALEDYPHPLAAGDSVDVQCIVLSGFSFFYNSLLSMKSKVLRKLHLSNNKPSLCFFMCHFIAYLCHLIRSISACVLP